MAAKPVLEVLWLNEPELKVSPATVEVEAGVQAPPSDRQPRVEPTNVTALAADAPVSAVAPRMPRTSLRIKILPLSSRKARLSGLTEHSQPSSGNGLKLIYLSNSRHDLL